MIDEQDRPALLAAIDLIHAHIYSGPGTAREIYHQNHPDLELEESKVLMAHAYRLLVSEVLAPLDAMIAAGSVIGPLQQQRNRVANRDRISKG